MAYHLLYVLHFVHFVFEILAQGLVLRLQLPDLVLQLLPLSLLRLNVEHSLLSELEGRLGVDGVLVVGGGLALFPALVELLRLRLGVLLLPKGLVLVEQLRIHLLQCLVIGDILIRFDLSGSDLLLEVAQAFVEGADFVLVVQDALLELL